MKELNRNELIAIFGGDKFSWNLGHCCGDVAQAITTVWNAYVNSGTYSSITGAVQRL